MILSNGALTIITCEFIGDYCNNVFTPAQSFCHIKLHNHTYVTMYNTQPTVNVNLNNLDK